MAGFGTVPADDEVIHDLTDTADFFHGPADVHIVAIDVDDTLKTHSMR